MFNLKVTFNYLLLLLTLITRQEKFNALTRKNQINAGYFLVKKRNYRGSKKWWDTIVELLVGKKGHFS